MDIYLTTGGWFDPSNRVVPMTGSLRGDLVRDLEAWESKTDLVLVLGTSLVGMCADSMFHEPAARAKDGE